MNQEIDYLAHYAQLRAQIDRLRTEIDRLDHEAHVVHKKARQQAAHKILGLMQEAGLTLADIDAKPGAKSHNKGYPNNVMPPRYRDRATGATWSGIGRAPRWIKGMEYNEFLIGADNPL